MKAVVCPVGVHVIEYGMIPPTAADCALPLAAPAQVTFALVGIVTTGAVLSFTLATPTTLQPFPSVIEMV